jgi:competence protein ComEC
VPLISLAVIAYGAGLFAGFTLAGPVILIGSAAVALAAIAARRTSSAAPLALIVAVGALVARDAPPPAPRSFGPPTTVLERWRARAGANIDSLFREDAPVVRALLIADTRNLPVELRDRYARAGLVHLLSISGLHVAIISGAVLLALQTLRLGPRLARWLAVAITGLYVVAIGAPAPALRSGAMLAAATAAWALQRPVSAWATLALGALIPLLADPRTILDLGYQLSVSGFAALTAASLWCKRSLPRDLSGWRRKLASDIMISTVATLASAPLVAWHFARISLIAPITNIVAAPVVALMQPALFLALVLAPLGAPAALAADGARLLVRALDGIAAAGSAVPGASIVAAPSFAVACLGGLAATCIVAAAGARRDRARWLGGALLAVAGMVWWPALPVAEGGMEIHLIDVGQGDAIAIRSPRGRWIVVDAGGGRAARNVGRRVVVPYLRRAGGDVALFVMTHPHDDHVGGAGNLIELLRPGEVRDAAFAGTSPAYREALVAARERGVPWKRIRPGDSVVVDGVVATFLAPDSAWVAALTDPNLASAVVRVRFGSVRALFTGDAEAAEEEWLLARDANALRADILKVAHHGSTTSSTPALLDAVAPTLALISVGANNRYRHPSPDVVQSLADRGIRIARTDRSGTIIVRTDPAGRTFSVDSGR